MEKETKYSFIAEFNEITNEQINNLINYFDNNGIKHHVLISDYELKKQKEIINKTKKAIQDMIHYGYVIPGSESDCAEYFLPQDENTHFGARAKELLKILENKEK